MRKYLLAIVAILVVLSTPATVAHAAPAVVTEFPFTEAVYNTCNDEMVIFTGTLVVETRLTQKSNTMTYSQRTWLEDVSATAGDKVYKVQRDSIDAFRTSVGRGQTTVLSRQASQLRLTPPDGEDGRLSVQAAYAFRTALDTGETRILYDKYKATCR